MYNGLHNQQLEIEDNGLCQIDDDDDDDDNIDNEENIDRNIQHSYIVDIDDENENYNCDGKDDDNDEDNRLFRNNYREINHNTHSYLRNSITSQSNHNNLVNDRHLLIL